MGESAGTQGSGRPTCAECETVFTVKAKTQIQQRFCSNKCRQRAWHRAHSTPSSEFRARRCAQQSVYYERRGWLLKRRRELQAQRTQTQQALDALGG